MNTPDSKLINREPAVAGQFYPSNKDTLLEELKQYFTKAIPDSCFGDVLAIISPHAGYVYSGVAAASAFNQIDPNKTYKNIFVLASSHRQHFEGGSIYGSGNYKTPLGEIIVNRELAKRLKEQNTVFQFPESAHLQEHSLEVQLPFLQYVMKTDFSITPIILGTQSAATCKLIAAALEPYFTEENLFIISTDCSHYPSYNDALNVDGRTAGAICQNSANSLLGALKENEQLKIDNLQTSLCGWTSVITLLYMSEKRKDINIRLIDYKNSGDSRYGDKYRVVGYNALAVETIDNAAENKNNAEFILSMKDEKDLLTIARETITEYLKNGHKPALDKSRYSPMLMEHAGAFVTLHKAGQLRGCIGRFQPENSLYEVIQDMAIAAATQDPRFSPVKIDELEQIELEISVLTPMKKIESIDEIELGKHGIYIKKGSRSGTFLPQVATETGWTKEQFLGNCAQNKAGIGWDGWKDADIYIYEAKVFSEKEVFK